MAEKPTYDEFEYKRMEEALREREHYLNAILEATQDGFWALDAEGRITDVNEAYCRMSGYNRDELLQLRIPDLEVDETPDETAARIKRIIENGSELFEVRHRRKDGGIFDVELSVACLDRGARRFICFCRDVTDRKRAEETLRESEETIRNKLRTILEPEGDIGTLNLADIINQHALQSMMEKFYRLTKIGGAILDVSGKVLASVGWQDICAKFHRRHPETLKNCLESDTVLSSDVPAGTFKPYRCKNNMWDMVTPIEVGGRHMGNIFIGQFFYAGEIPDQELFRDQARRYGFDEAEYLAALDHVPCLSPEMVDTAMAFYAEIAGMISSLGYSTVKLSRALSQKEAALRRLAESEKTHRTLVECLPDIIMRFDRRGRHLFVSENVNQVVDLQSSEFIGKTHRELGFPEEQCRFWEKSIQRVFDNGLPLEAEFNFESKQGVVTHNWRLRPELDTRGAIRSVLSLSRDITEHRKSEQNYQTLFREMLDGFALHEIILDTQGKPVDYRFLAVNPAFERMTGLKAAHAVGSTVLEVLPNTEQHWIETYGRVALTGEPVFFENHAAELNKYFEVRAFRPLPNQFACIFADITDRKMAEREHEKLSAQLLQAQKMESIGRLAGGVAHDFNNKLGVILGHVELLLMDMEPDHPIYEDLEQIQDAAAGSADLTRQLLAFARKQPIAPRELDINETIAGMLKMLERLIGENIDLAWQPDTNLWSVKMDPTQVDQILANLAVNARDSIDGVGKVAIETKNRVLNAAYCAEHDGTAPGEFVIIAVTDNGRGMEKTTLDQIFEPFFSTKEIGKGTGLGLSTVYGIAKQNNGFISVYSEPEKGTTFKIHIPRYRGDTSPEALTKSETPPRGNGETILLVEDDPAILRLARMMLERLGYAVLTANSPHEAMAIAGEHSDKIPLLMTDVVMPQMNGKDLAEQVMKIRPETRVLFMSGYTADAIARHGILDEGVHFIEKPFTSGSLARKVRKVLDVDSNRSNKE